MNRPNGYILAEFPAYVVIATGIHRASDNRKTGPMIQVHILVRDQSPMTAVSSGRDAIICMDCPHRGIDGWSKRTCYVNLSTGENQVYRTYLRGNYPFLPVNDYRPVFTGRGVRFGTYGEPVLIPLDIVREIVRYASTWTGYTHQWGRVDAEYSRYFMASVDTESQAHTAHMLGYRTFRVRLADTPHMEREIECPAYTRGVQCADCGLCMGNTRVAKNIAIQVHGRGSKHLADKLVNIR